MYLSRSDYHFHSMSHRHFKLNMEKTNSLLCRTSVLLVISMIKSSVISWDRNLAFTSEPFLFFVICISSITNTMKSKYFTAQYFWNISVLTTFILARQSPYFTKIIVESSSLIFLKQIFCPWNLSCPPLPQWKMILFVYHTSQQEINAILKRIITDGKLMKELFIMVLAE